MFLDNMRKRLEYAGGNQQGRMNKDKLHSLKQALLYSYQAATAKLSDGREFRCLINKNKLSPDLDDKILSIPFKDICLNEQEIGTTTEGMVETNIKEGDVIEWKENGSHWLVLLQRLEETAYFRANIRRCRYEITLDNGKTYWASVRGPVEQNIQWLQSGGNYINALNNTLMIYLTQNEETLQYFHRFTKVVINGQTWETQAIDNISTPGVIQVYLKEAANNTPETDIEKAVENSINVDIVKEQEDIYIHGSEVVYPYDVKTYEIRNYSGEPGSWFIAEESRKNIVKIASQDQTSATVQIITGRSAKFTLVYKTVDAIIATLEIDIDSL